MPVLRWRVCPSLDVEFCICDGQGAKSQKEVAVSEVKTVTVTSCVPKKRGDGSFIEGTSQYGKPWRIHSVLATDDTGLPIQDELVAFDMLPVGEPVELEFVRKESEQYGVSYTVSLPKGSRATRPRVTDDAIEMTRESIRLLADRVRACEDALRAAGLMAASTVTVTDAPAVVQPAVPVGAAPASSDQDIPF